MEQGHHLAFGPFRFDGTQGRLWQGDQRIALRPHSLALLRYLVEHPGRLVTKAELRQHVWAGTHVTDTVLRVSVHEIRQALGDAAGSQAPVEEVEAVCDGLAAQQHLLDDVGLRVWPDGTRGGGAKRYKATAMNVT